MSDNDSNDFYATHSGQTFTPETSLKALATNELIDIRHECPMHCKIIMNLNEMASAGSTVPKLYNALLERLSEYGYTLKSEVLFDPVYGNNQPMMIGCLIEYADHRLDSIVKLLRQVCRKAKKMINKRHGMYEDTPLMLALCQDKFSFARVLLEAGASVNATNVSGNTAAHVVFHLMQYRNAGIERNSFIEMLRTILSSGANVNAPNKDQHTPMDILFRTRHKYSPSELRKIIELLIKYDARMTDESTLPEHAPEFLAMLSEARANRA